MAMLNLKRLGLLALAVASAACSDSSGGRRLTQTPDASCGLFGCEEADMGDMGPTGGTMPTVECTEDAVCAPNEYCARADENDLTGTCTRGCRDDASCPEGQLCDPSTRLCGGCSADTGCPEGQYCDAGAKACVEGCRTEPNSCEAGQVCDAATRACVAAVVCCTGDERTTCGVVQDAAACAGGQVIDSLSSCDPNPCGPTCETDADCAGDRYCSEFGLCALGCRTDDPGACPAGQVCDPGKHICEPGQACQTDAECPEGRFCDAGAGICSEGCRQDPSSCDAGEVCNNQRDCVSGCEADASCPNGAYCDPVGFFCRDFCGSSDDCTLDEFCAPAADGGRCVVGCRDDETDPPNDSPATATALQLVNNRAEVRGALLCGGNPDVYAIPMLQGYRVQVTLEFDAGVGDMRLRLVDRDEVTELAALNDLGSPKRIQYPAAGMGFRVPDDYFVEVSSDDAVSQTYTLRVVVIDAINDACFPDLSEEANNGRGFNNQDNAQPINWDGVGDELFCFNGSACNGDEDWFTFPGSSVNAGFSLQLSVDGLVDGDAVVETFAASRARNGLANPNYTTAAGMVTPQGRTLYEIDVPRDTVGLSDEPWLIRLRGETDNVVIDNYDLCVRLLQPGQACREDAAEPNDLINAVGANANLDALPGVTMNGRLRRSAELALPLDLALCAQETDLFRFRADDGDQIQVTATSDALAGTAVVEIIGAADGNVRGTGGLMGAAGSADPAVFNGAQPGEYFVRVRAVGAGSADPYSLSIRIDPSAMCGADRAEVGPGAMRNDAATSATPLDALPGANTRFEYDNGLVCNVPDNVGDKDWYRFSVQEPRSRICVATNAFAPAAGNLDLRLYTSVTNVADDVACQDDLACRRAGAPGVCLQGAQRFCGCRTDNDCDANGNRVLEDNEGYCIASRCRIATQLSAHNGSPEALDVQKDIVDAGDYYVLVSGADASQENSYNLAISVTPPGDTCAPDWREQLGDNDDVASATDLGAGEAAVCDAWLCADPRNMNDERGGLGDHYRLLVPAGEDRTVHLSYSRFTDGSALLTYLPLDDDGMVVDFGENPDRNGQANSECLVIRGGATDANVVVLVSGDVALNDGDKRVDYSLWVRPTDVARDGANGRCEEFGPLVNVWDVQVP